MSFLPADERDADARLLRVELGAGAASSDPVGALSGSYGSRLFEARGGCREERLAELDACPGADEAVVPSESSRRLLADVFGLVRLTESGSAAAGAASRDGSRGCATVGGEVEDDSDSGSGSGSGSGAIKGMANKSPKSAFSTWWRL